VTLRRKSALSTIAILCLLTLVGSAAAQQVSSGSFAGRAAHPDSAAIDASSVGVASVTVAPAKITGGASTVLTVNLTGEAPSGGLTVTLKTTDPSVVLVPATLTIASGHKSATTTVWTETVTATTTASLSAHSGSTVAGASLEVTPKTAGSFSVSLHPATVTIKPGDSGSTTVTTKTTTGYDHSLTLSASSVPSGVSIDFSPPVIAAPGSGSSTANITVDSSATEGTDTIPIEASDGTHSSKVNLKLKVGSSSSGPGASFQGCWYVSGGNQYQGVVVGVTNPGSYPFNGTLYYGSTCDPNNWADQIGFGEDINFGGFDWVFWFSRFANQANMATQWTVGSDTSACFTYENAPVCP